MSFFFSFKNKQKMVPTIGFQIEKGNCLGDLKSSREEESESGISGDTGKDKMG